MKLCKVCSVPVKSRRGYFQNICEACQKFFRRYAAKRETLVCYTGDLKCAIDESSRRYCLKCRFEKCLAAGLHFKAITKTTTTKVDATPNLCDTTISCRAASSSSSSNTTAAPLSLLCEPLLFDGFQVEQTLRNAINAFALLHGYHFLPMSEPFDVSNFDRRDKVVLTSQHISAGVETSAKYCQFLSEREGLLQHETQMLMAGFTARTGLVFPTLAGRGNASFFGIHRGFKSEILKEYPIFSICWVRTEQLDETLMAWNPGFIETAVFIALNFFNERTVSNPKLAAIRRRLLLAINLLKQQESNHSSTSGSDVVERSRKFMRQCLNSTAYITMAMLQDLARLAAEEPAFAQWNAIV